MAVKLQVPAASAARLAASGFRSQLANGASDVEAYVQAVNRVPLLSEAEEARLSGLAHDRGDAKAAQALALANLRYVVSVARSFSGLEQPFEDLIQEGGLALLEGIRRYRPGAGFRLTSFLTRRVRSHIADFIVHSARLAPIPLTRAQRDLFFELRRLYGADWQELRGAGLRRAAARLKVQPPRIRELQSLLCGNDIALFSCERRRRPRTAGADDPLVDPDSTIEAQLSQTWREDALQNLYRAVSQLDPRSRDIIQQRWLAAPAQKVSRNQLSLQYGVSSERIRQLEGEALRKIRLALVRQG